MQDSDIRGCLHSHLRISFENDKDTIIVDELDLCSGLSRVDIAVINGQIHGYEIKSEEDTLKRLPNQIKYYNKSLEKITIAVNEIHFSKILEVIPDWWGILVIENDLTINIARNAQENPLIEGTSLLELLWSNELRSIAAKYDVKSKLNSPKRKLREQLIKELTLFQISYEVRDALKLRQNWRT
jgi:hypothetical protein